MILIANGDIFGDLAIVAYVDSVLSSDHDTLADMHTAANLDERIFSFNQYKSRQSRILANRY